MASQDARLSKFEADFKQQQSEMTNKIDTVLKAITDRIAGTLPSDMIKNPKLGTHPVSSARSYPTRTHNTQHKFIAQSTPSQSTPSNPRNPKLMSLTFICFKEDDGEIMFIEIIRDDNEPQNEGPNEGVGETTKEPVVEYFDTFPTRDELTYHRLYLMRRSLEVLRKFHWMILGGRFNQLSHVSSPLLSKPGEY
ncbi:hypothetical protein Tco_0105109 [Tanacetum coccineum]